MGQFAKICAIFVAFALFGFVILIAMLKWGVPLHDFRLWWLEKNFQEAALYHPRESMPLQKKTYLGGLAEHGSLRCDFFVGELRSAPLSKEKIWQAYVGRSIKAFNYFGFLNSERAPLQVLFFDEERWTMDSPLSDWWDELSGSPLITAANTAYFVFASQEGYPYLGDYRCDD